MKRHRWPGLALGMFVLFCTARPAAATIHYKISLARPEQHRYQVTMTIPAALPGTEVAIPAWNALYQVRDFAYRVRDVQAAKLSPAGGAPERIAATKPDKQTWVLGDSPLSSGGTPEDLQVTYSIEWNDPGPFNSQLNPQHAFVNFAEILFYIPNRRGESVDVEFTDLATAWKSVAELPQGSAPNSFTAASYDALVDAPVEIGAFDQFDFEKNGAHFRVILNSVPDRASLSDKLQKVVDYETHLMGGPPFKEYTFFLKLGPYTEVGGGGMEHSNCTAISASSQQALIEIAAHEFFHAWNVKRIRPHSLEPVDFTKEQYTRALWFAEGVTSTYGSFALARSGDWSTSEFYSEIGNQITELDSRSARRWQSVEESSLDTWFDKYEAYDAADRSISYYNKGELIGDMLDLAIRDATDNHKSLDDVMRLLNTEFAQRGFFYNGSADIRRVVEQVSAKSFEDFFRSYVSGTEEIPYEKYLSLAGLHLKEATKQLAEPGFWPGRGPANGWKVSSVTTASPAEAAGLHEGDEIMLLNGEAPTRNPAFWLRSYSPGQTITLRVRRESHEQEIRFVLGSRDEREFSIEEISNPTERQSRIRAGFLRGTTD